MLGVLNFKRILAPHLPRRFTSKEKGMENQETKKDLVVNIGRWQVQAVLSPLI